MRDALFSSFNPAVTLFYLTAVIALSVTLMHPICLIISLVCAISWAVSLDRKKALSFALKAVLPMMLLAAIINPLFNHSGQTILAYFPNGNPLTLESLAYGAAAAGMLGAALLWFFCFNRIISGDKLVYLFGKAAPSIALLFSMSLSFVPRFSKRFSEVANAQRGLYGVAGRERLKARLGRGIGVLSITVTWALESSVVTADSMRSRGYGLPGRKAFSRYRFCARDFFLFSFSVLFCGITIFSAATSMRWRYFPDFEAVFSGADALLGFLAYFLLCAAPCAIDLWEVRLWKRLESRV